MAIDPSRFQLLNVVDTCAVWNVLSSRLLYQTALQAGCVLSCTAYVVYECLYKRRTTSSQADNELTVRLRAEQQNGRFMVYHLDLEELLEVEMLAKRRNLGRGEISSIAFARRTRQAFLTDDQRARRLATQLMPEHEVQTTPHLLGWLYFRQLLADGDLQVIIDEHDSLGRPLRQYFEEMYTRALHYRLLASSSRAPGDAGDGPSAPDPACPRTE